MTDKILGMLGLMRKAGAIEIGSERTEIAIATGKAKLVTLPADASPKAKSNAEIMLEGKSARRVIIPYSNSVFASALGVGSCSTAAVTDLGFAEAFLKALDGAYPGQYTEELAQISQKAEKQARRKREKPGKKNL